MCLENIITELIVEKISDIKKTNSKFDLSQKQFLALKGFLLSPVLIQSIINDSSPPYIMVEKNQKQFYQKMKEKQIKKANIDDILKNRD